MDRMATTRLEHKGEYKMPNINEFARQEELTSFEKENFSSRRTTGHNLYDPNATITQGELQQGFTYQNSYRPVAETWEQYVNAVTPATPALCPPNVYEVGPGVNLENLAPRVFKPGLDPNRTTKLSEFVERNTDSSRDLDHILYLHSSCPSDLPGDANFSFWHDKTKQALHIWGNSVFVSLEQAIKLRDWLTAHIDHATKGGK